MEGKNAARFNIERGYITEKDTTVLYILAWRLVLGAAAACHVSFIDEPSPLNQRRNQQ